ncbi:MAG: TRAP transporter large permease [Myxococcota bacterium]
MSLAYIWLFVLLLGVGMPVVFVLLASPALSLTADGQSVFLKVLLSRLYNGIDSFPLMAVPCFILAGEAMNAGGITRSLVRFSQVLIGHVRGGLAHVNILSSILFAGLSGSAVADASALGKILIPAMEQDGYTRRFAAAITAASAVIGPIIPPSGIMILYAFIMKVPVAALFAAGIVPGVLVGAGLMGMTALLASARDLPRSQKRSSLREVQKSFWVALPALLTPILLLGGILSGLFTPTEAAAVAATYALIVSVVVYRTLTWRDLPGVFTRAAGQSGAILLLVGAAVTFAWIISVSGLAAQLAAALSALNTDVVFLLFLVNLFLFVAGMFLDAGPAILILGPLLGELFLGLGVHPVHFAVIMCVNLTVGLATPPMGLVLFVSASVSREKIEAIAKEMLPFLLVEVAVIFLITYIPELSLTLPRILGLL